MTPEERQIYNSNYYLAHRDTIINRTKVRDSNNRDAHIARTERSKQKLSVREHARDIVQRAIRTGRIIRLPCEVCKKSNTHAHHPDHSKPLEIQWLCSTHHGEKHRKLILEAASQEHLDANKE